MKAVRYPTNPIDRNKLKQRYVDALWGQKNKKGNSKLQLAQKTWSRLRRKLPDGSRLPSKIRKILRAEFSKLISYYEDFVDIRESICPEDFKELTSIFSYDTYHETIADFFMDSQNGFNLTVCHYCETAYINKYTVNYVRDGLDIINQASIHELESLLRISRRSAQIVDQNKPYTSIDQFNNLRVFRSLDKFHSVFPSFVDKNHFDLDHVLDKDSCPITAISLMNFVPSCSVCNEKLKRTNVLGRGGVPLENLSPTSRLFDFDAQVTFSLRPKPGCVMGNRPTANPDAYELDMDVNDPDYDEFIELFRLRERYRFHKLKALYWLEIKYRYTDSRIAMMANSFHDASFSPKRIKDDIFQRSLDKTEGCFQKLKKDILK